MNLPKEIREQVYRLLLGEEDIHMTASSIESLERLICEDVHRVLNIRQEGSRWHPAIVRVNRTTNAEASRVLYDRIFTITVSSHHIGFLGHRYRKEERDCFWWPYHGPHRRIPTVSREIMLFPASFPFHRIETLRIRVLSPIETVIQHGRSPAQRVNGLFEPDTRRQQRSLHKHLSILTWLLNACTSKELPLKRLFIDARSRESYYGPRGHRISFKDDLQTTGDVQRLFNALGPIRNIQNLQIGLPVWMSNLTKAADPARQCGRWMLSQSKSDERTEPVIVFG